ncbi:MAG: hypothetical protein IIT82_07680 [Selenomonas sp.]|nr:hypothetical protein [Selenomonas sp.]
MTIETERNSQAQANPVFMTAKTAICLMAAANIPDNRSNHSFAYYKL